MTLVILGTQDKNFKRLIVAVEKEVKKKKLSDVIIQAGSTKYESKYMQVMDYIDMDKFDYLIDNADLIITHGGVGTILSSIQKNKKVIAVPRLSKYKEHENDHQIEIVTEFSKKGYILECIELKKLSETIDKVDSFKPKKYVSNNNKMIKLIEKYIDNI